MTSITQVLPLATLSHDEWLEPLVLERWCEDCGRSGVVANPLWQEFREEFEGVSFTTARAQRDAEERWWIEHGYSYVNMMLGTGVPPEERSCAECEGRGRLLTDEGLVLAGFIHRWQAK